MEIAEKRKKSSTKGSVIFRGINSIRGIVAQALEAQFVEQGIVGQPLSFRKIKKNYALYYVKCHKERNSDDANSYYIVHDKQAEPPKDPLTFWTPATIPKQMWELAVSQFLYSYTLAYNIKKYLLPQYDSVLDLFSYEQLWDMTIQAFLMNDILMQPIRIAKRSAYFFDENQIYRKDMEGRWPTDERIRSLWYCGDIDMRVFAKAASSFQVGSTLGDCVDEFLKTDLYTAFSGYSPLELLVTRVGPVSCERIPENEDPKTFDHIRVQVNLSHTVYPTWEKLKEGVMGCRKEIDDLVIKKIESSPGFLKFGVPLSALRLTSLVLSRKYFLEYIFELKDVCL